MLHHTFSRLNIIFVLLFFTCSNYAQTPLVLSFGDVSAEVGEEVCVPITCENFNNILGMQLSINYDPTILEFKRIDNPERKLRIDLAFIEDNFGLPGTGQIQPGTITYVWFGAGARPVDLADSTQLFEICFTVLSPDETFVVFSQEPTPIQVVDGNDVVLPFTGNPGTINKPVIFEGPSFTISKDSVFVEVDYLQTIDRTNIPLENQIRLFSTQPDSIDLRIQKISETIPTAWTTTCNLTVDGQNFPCEPNAIPLIEPDTIDLNHRFTLIEHNRTSGVAETRYHIYDANDSLTTNYNITFVKSFIYPEIDGPSFSIVDINDPDTILVTNESQFPISLPFSKSFVSNTEAENLNIKWELVSKTIPSDWQMMCNSNLDLCNPLGSGVFNLDAASNLTWEGSQTISAIAMQMDQEATYTYLFYDEADSLKSHYLVDLTFRLRFPSISKGTFTLDSDLKFEGFTAQSTTDEVIVFGDTLFMRIQSIFDLNLGWKVIDQSWPADWEVQFESNLMGLNNMPDLGLIPEGGSSIFQPTLDTVLIPIQFSALNINNTPGTAMIDILVYDQQDSLNSQRVISVQYQICPPPTQVQFIQTDSPGQICPDNPISLSISQRFEEISWGNGAQSATVIHPASEMITVEAQDTNQCVYRDTARFEFYQPHQDSICLVTVDPATGKNAIFWTPTPGQRTMDYLIYKEDLSGRFQVIGMTTFENGGVFIDQNATPQENNARYAIATRDSCGTASLISAPQETMLLSITNTDQGMVELNWTPYQGFPFVFYKIKRGADPTNLTTLAQALGSTNSYTDMSPPGGTTYYQIQIEVEASCLPEGELFTLTSNFAINQTTSLNNTIAPVEIHWSPNPTQSFLNIEWQEEAPVYWQIIAHDALGKQVQQWHIRQSAETTLDLSQFTGGMYYFSIISPDGLVQKKQIIKID